MAFSNQPDALTLPGGTRLVHIGPSKTGTTSLQSALWAGRRAMREQGVLYAGHHQHSNLAARAVVGLRYMFADDERPPPLGRWKAIVRQIRSAREPRIVFSSEFLAHAEPDVVRRVVEDLDPARVHVAVTLRPLARILPSQWQQDIQAGRVLAYEDWLRRIFATGDQRTEARVWHRHRHDRLVERWASVVGPDRVTAVVVDDRDHARLLRAFEQLLGLQGGTLQLERDMANRSLTVPEVEAIRALNVAILARHLGRGLQAHITRSGVAPTLKRRVPRPDESRVRMPGWALEPTLAVARDIIDGISASGVRVIGNLETLSEVPDVAPAAGSEDEPTPGGITPEIAASMAMGVLFASGLARGRGRIGTASLAEPADVARIPSRQVASTIMFRARHRVRVSWAASRQRVGRLVASR